MPMLQQALTTTHAMGWIETRGPLGTFGSRNIAVKLHSTAATWFGPLRAAIAAIWSGKPAANSGILSRAMVPL